MKDKEIAVIIPTYKRALFLKRAIDSVLSQTYSNVTVIVVDDNDSGDEYRKATEEIMKEYQFNNKVVYLKHLSNKNGAAARNTGLKYTEAPYVSFLDDDDFFMPKKLENQINSIKDLDDNWGGVFCYHVRRYKKHAYATHQIASNGTGNYCFEFLSGITSTPSSTLLLKREVFDEIGLFDESFNRHQDLEFLVRLYRKYKMAISPSYDLYMQIEGFRNYPNSSEAYKHKSKFLEKYKKDILLFNIDEQKAIYKSQWFEVACLYLKDRDFKNAKKLFKIYIFNDNKVEIKDCLRVMFFVTSGYMPFLKKLTAYALGLTKYKKFSKILS